MNKLEKNQNYTNETFEDIKHIDENGVEFWYARELIGIFAPREKFAPIYLTHTYPEVCKFTLENI